MASDKVISTGLSVKCDRCKKTVAVADNEECDFYRTFAERSGDQKDEHMFVSVLLPFAGDPIDIDFEYICPGCAKAILGYMAKIDKGLEKFLPKKPPKDKDKAKDEDAKGGAETGKAKPDPEAKTKDKDKAKEPEKKPEPEAKDPDPEPEPEKKSSIKITDEREGEGEGEPADPEPEKKPEEAGEPGTAFDDNDLFDD